jgi:hypothetical protein
VDDMWIHCISVDSERAAGVIESKIFKTKFSKEAIKWFDKRTDSMAIGHLTEHVLQKKSRERVDIYYYRRYTDSIGNSFLLWAFKQY